MPKPNYSLQSKFEQEERAKLEHQNHCPHPFWTNKCSVCSKILASDHHINFHTPRSFKKNNRVAIYKIEAGSAGEIDLYRIHALKQLSQDFDEVTVLVDSLSHYEMYSQLKPVTRTNIRTLDDEIKNMRKYRKDDVEEITLVLYPDTLGYEEYVTEAKKLKISTLTI